VLPLSKEQLLKECYHPPEKDGTESCADTYKGRKKK